MSGDGELPSDAHHGVLGEVKKSPTWKTVTLRGRTLKEYTNMLKEKDVNISPWAKEIMGKVQTSEVGEAVNLVRVKVSDMKIDADYPTTKQIYAWAKNNGLELCSAEVALALFNTELPEGEYHIVAMEPITCRDGDPVVFSVRLNPDGLFLDARSAGPGHGWRADIHFLFRLRKLDS